MQEQRVSIWQGSGETAFYFCVFVVFLHSVIETQTGISVVERAASDFMTKPVPSWTWPTWLAFLTPLVVGAIVWYLVYAWKRDRRKAEELFPL